MDKTEERIRYHAEQLWREKGQPEGGPEAYYDQARELAAIEENYHLTMKPVREPGPYGEPVEENVPLENLGEFPTLVDQGEEQTFPDRDPGDVDQSNRIEPRSENELDRADRLDERGPFERPGAVGGGDRSGSVDDQDPVEALDEGDLGYLPLGGLPTSGSDDDGEDE